MRFELTHKYVFLAVVFFANLSFGFAQSVSNQIYDQANHKLVEKYQLDKGYESLVLSSSFSKEEIRKIPFTDRRIIKIDLVYTEFSESDQFDQKQLDLARISNLIEINPQITVNKFFDWNIIGQTGCNSSSECRDFFHGFVVYYDTYYTKETAKIEIDSINQEMKELDQQIVKLSEQLLVKYDRIDCIYPESLYSEEYLTEQLEKVYECSEKYKGRVFFDIRIDYNGRPLDVNVKGNLFPCKDKLAFALKYITKWNRGLVIGRKQYGVTAKGYAEFPLKGAALKITSFEIDKEQIDEFHMLQQYSQCVAYHTDTTFTPILPKIEKRVVSNVMLRNRWDPSLMIVDVTGSMYPFTADMLKWIRLSGFDEAKTFVFFNDGDDKPAHQKEIGKTGGVYHVTSADYQEVKRKMFEVMRRGGGGDLVENNMEALMYGVKVVNNPRDVIMIADNYSFPRDWQLLARYDRDLKIILCHTEKGINTDYLNLARKYGFTLHTEHTDISNLNKKGVGERLKIEGVEYALTNQGFVRIY